MKILGISAFYHDSAAALVVDGNIVGAAQEERFSRIKADSEFPVNAIQYCLGVADCRLDQLDAVVFYDKPILSFDRLLETYLEFAPRGLGSLVQSMPVWTKTKLFLKSQLIKSLAAMEVGEIDESKIAFCSHHHSHAASSFYPSPFETAGLLVMDGVGEWATTSLGMGDCASLELHQEIRFPHSIGLLYSAMTYYLGFKVNDGEYKVMGLAPYGEPKYVQTILDNLVDLKDDGSYRLDLSYFDYCTGLKMTNRRFDDLFGGLTPRTPESKIGQREMDLACSIQKVTEEVVLRLAKTVYNSTGQRNLCLSGGVALNCVANGRILREGPFENLWIQPAAGDAGGALGAALAATYAMGFQRKVNASDQMNGAYLGPSFEDSEIESILNKQQAQFETLDDEQLLKAVAQQLSSGKIVGWFQGRMEFGPRSLGNRSILGDPRSTRMQKYLNQSIKYRESFRPFAPSVLGEKTSEYFDLNVSSPYMLLVSDVRRERRLELPDGHQELDLLDRLNIPRSDIPAVTHVDYSARIQTVDKSTNPKFHALLENFEQITGCGVLVNTSFNVRDEPIVCSPEDAYLCFMGTEMDILVLGNTLLYKADQ
jgi:carbamoyltransferase